MARVDRAEREWRWGVIVQHADQPARCHRVVDEKVGQLDQAAPVQCHFAQHFAVVRAQRPRHRDGFRTFPGGPGVLPCAGAAVAVDQAAVAGQIGRGGRRAGGGEVGGAGAGQQVHAADPACHQAGVGQWPDAHGQVVAFADEVDHAVVQIHRQLDLRIGGEEGRHARRQMQGAERHRRADAQAAARARARALLADGIFGLFDG